MYKIITGSKDCYITNKIINNSFRATDANTGLAGTLDLFKLYDESTISGESEPIELSRILIKFDYDKITNLLNLGLIDINHDSFKVFLNLKDVYGGQTTPADFKLIAMPLAVPFNEGKGRDVVNYKDVDRSNFITASYSAGTTNLWNVAGARASGSLGGGSIDVIISGSIQGPAGTSVINLTSEQLFVTGKEDLMLDVTKVVSSSVSGQITNHGFVVAYSGSYEQDNKTYFVKRFTSNNSSDIFSRPKMIVKFDDSIIDNHNNFNFNVTGSLFLNNFHGETKSNIRSGTFGVPIEGTDCMKLIIKSGSYASTHSVSQHKVGDNFQTGVYSASFVIDEFDSDIYPHIKLARSSSFTQIWSSNDLTVGFLTGSLIIRSPFRSSFDGSVVRLSVACKNLKDTYRKNDEVKIRVFIQDREEKIIFKKKPVEATSNVYDQMFYRVIDIQTGKIIVPFDTVSNSTKLSSDSDGMYFKFDMSSLESGRAYKFEFLIKEMDTDVYINDASGKFILRD